MNGNYFEAIELSEKYSIVIESTISSENFVTFVMISSEKFMTYVMKIVMKVMTFDT